MAWGSIEMENGAQSGDIGKIYFFDATRTANQSPLEVIGTTYKIRDTSFDKGLFGGDLKCITDRCYLYVVVIKGEDGYDKNNLKFVAEIHEF